MKKVLSLLLSFGVLTGVSAQNKLFVRVYDSSGDKIAKGYIAEMGDSGLRLRGGKGADTTLPVSGIHKIRLHRHPFRIGALVAALPVGAGVALILDGQGWNGLVGIVIIMEGLALGGAATGIKAILQPRTLRVEGDAEKWQSALEELNRRMRRPPVTN